MWPFLASLLVPHALALDVPVAVVPLSALRAPEPEVDLRPPASILVARLDASLAPGSGGEATVELRYELEGLDDRPVDLPVAGSALAVTSALLDGRPVALAAGDDGLVHLSGRFPGRHVLAVRGSLRAERDGIDLPVLAAARSSVTGRAPGTDFRVGGAVPERVPEGVPAALPAAGRLQVGWQPAAPPTPRPQVVTAESAVALSMESGGLVAAALLRYRVLHARAEEVRFRLDPRAEGLVVEGPGVVATERQGDEVAVRFARPVEGDVALRLAWRARGPEGDDPASAPIPVPVAARATSWVSALRADESIVVPEPGAGMEAVPARALPEWAQGLAEGTPIATWRCAGTPSVSWRALVHEPANEPPTLVDEAVYEVAYAEHGRLLLRARYQVRNDRNQYLALTLPPGLDVVGARVAGTVVQPVREDGGKLYVPLEKSVETLEGLVRFPVEVVLAGRETAWERRGRRSLRTPAIDAPVASARWEIALPPGVAARRLDGTPRRVEAWTGATGGIEYGRAVQTEEYDLDGQAVALDAVATGRGAGLGGKKKRKADAPSPATSTSAPLQEASQEVWNEAYRAYKENRFDDADVLLDQSLELDPDNAAARALQGNVEVLKGEAGGGDDENASRSARIRELARAKTGNAERAQEALEKEVDRDLRSGDFEAATGKLRELVEVTEQLAAVEQAESFEQKGKLADLRDKLSSAQARNEADAKAEEPPPPDANLPAGAFAGAFVVDAEEILGSIELEAGEVAIVFGADEPLDAPAAAAPAAPPTVIAPSPSPSPASATTATRATRRSGAGHGGAPPEKKPARPTLKVPLPPEGVTASALTVHIPRAGEVLLLEQRLVAEDAPLSIELRYRTRRNRP